ncbi:Tetratricopeptide repeat protein [Raphanus sativus]|nr:Tetratricopeptide repeat protein [Raphanus sativus]
MLSEKAAWALAMDRRLNMVSINPGLIVGPSVAQHNLGPPCPTSKKACRKVTVVEKRAAQMYENGVLAYVDAKFLADVHIRAFEDVSACGRYFCFNQIVNTEEEALKLVQSLSPLIPMPPRYESVMQGSEVYEERLRNNKLSKLVEAGSDGVDREREEILTKYEQNLPSSSSPQAAATETKQADAGDDDSEGFETASEREVSGEEDDSENDAVTNHEEAQMEPEEAVAEANEAKVEGNSLFVNGLYEDALSKYMLALELVQEFPDCTELRAICHLNRGVCLLKLGKYEETIKECTKALELNPTYAKALVRRAEAHEKLEHFEEAVTDLKKILELDPSNDQARKGIRTP